MGIGLGQIPNSNPNIELGRPCPQFNLSKISYYNRKEVSLADLAGKHVILDFWTIGCTSCIESFKKIDAIRRKNEDRVEFFVIGQDHLRKGDYNSAIKAFEKYRERWNLDLPAVYDSTLFKQFNVTAVPYSVWIDDKGILRALTYSTDINDENVKAFLEGRKIKSSYRLVERFDYHEPLLINGNGGFDSVFLFRSLLAPWNVNTAGYWQPFITSVDTRWAGVKKNRVQMNGASLSQLIELAYGDSVKHTPPWYGGEGSEEKMNALSSYGRVWINPVLEVKDTSDFSPNWKTGENAYSYSLIVPAEKVSAAYLKKTMQSDLEKYFDYDISVETRPMPCWYLTANEKAKSSLKTKGEEADFFYQPTGFQITNVPFYQLICIVWAYNTSQPPIINNTGISGYVDLKLNAAMMDFDDVISALQEKGLFLKKGIRDMQVIVVRDNKE